MLEISSILFCFFCGVLLAIIPSIIWIAFLAAKDTAKIASEIRG